MSEEKMSCFYELINGFEIVGTLTDDGRKLVKDGVLHLQQENKRLKEVIEEVRENVETQKKKPYKSLSEKATICNKYNELLQILDKGVKND